MGSVLVRAVVRPTNSTYTDSMTHTGLACVGAGTWMEWGMGWSLMVYGVLLVMAALVSLKWHTLRSTAKWLEQHSER